MIKTRLFPESAPKIAMISGKDSDFLINQQEAADFVFKLLEKINIKDPSLKAFKETNIYKLRRGLCLPCAVLSSVNFALGEKRFKAQNIANFYKQIIKMHGIKGVLDAKTGKEFEKGWLVMTSQGDVYHHAIIWWLRKQGLKADSVIGFKNIEIFRDFVNSGGVLTISLNNLFVAWWIKHLYPGLVDIKEKHDQKIIYLKTLNKKFLFQNGRHVVTLLKFNKKSAVIADSYILPGIQKKEQFLEVSLQTINFFLNYHDKSVTRGIIVYPISSCKDKSIKKFINLVSLPK